MRIPWKKIFFWRKGGRRNHEIAPDEVLLDSSNLPNFNTAQFEGRLGKPISLVALYATGGAFVLGLLLFLFKAGQLQIVQGKEYFERSENNVLRPVPVFAGRGVLFDRNGTMLAWNAPGTDSPTVSKLDPLATSSIVFAEDVITRREYATSSGMAHVLGYVKYPSKDSNGFYYQEDFEGVDGIEDYFDENLRGVNGSRLVEVDARGKVLSHNIVRSPVQGQNLTLSIDAQIQSSLYSNIRDIAQRVGFTGGAGVIMDVHTGELIALTSYPEYDPQVMSDKTNSAAVRAMLNDSRLPFLDRAVDGLYAPGSIVKPYMALAALNEKVVEPSTVITPSGFISIPNPYDKTKSTVFRDWKAHGPVDIRKALAVSSDVYFYVVGGGYKDMKGLGIARIDSYLSLFGFGKEMSESFVTGKAGVIPTPEWKKETFDEDWYVGDTYNTSIGQYGFLVTPVQIARAVAAVANGGKLLVPSILKTNTSHVESTVDIPAPYFQVVREGMRMGTTEGTGVALNVPYVKIATKSGTAELGVAKDHVNSWITGFWPYENPRYAFAVLLEKGSVHNLIGAAAVMRQQLDWMHTHTPDYFKE
ncbi:MAG: penicillin-binding protein 2 [Parcubacteria bacterium C7867-002]|nr:MAG: penicillin-binding protein 2 [Parcubacteria bacterium C7867-002]